MKAFLVGLAVLILMGVFSVLSLLLLPLILVLGLFLRLVIGVVLVLFAVWLTGKVTLYVIDTLRKKEGPPAPTS